MPTLTRNTMGSIAGGSRGTPVAPHIEPNTACDDFNAFANDSGNDYDDDDSDTTVQLQVDQPTSSVVCADQNAGKLAATIQPPNFDEKSTSTLNDHSSIQMDPNDEMNDKPYGSTARFCPPDDCPICFDFFADPITLQCRHSFCRACLLECTRLAPNGQSCPLCRQSLALDNLFTVACDASLQDQVINFVGKEIYATRSATAQAHIESLAQSLSSPQGACMPIFTMPGAVRLGQRMNLHFFEPRYKLLIRRVWSSNHRCFVYSPWAPAVGRFAAVVRVDRARFWRDGRASIVARVVAASVLLSDVWVEEGTGGLACARIAHEEGWAESEGTEGQQHLPLPPHLLEPARRTTCACVMM